MDETISPAATSSDVRVLLIDDSKSARRVTAAQLVDAGWKVITAADGFAALADVVEHRPHVIVADIVMPRLDGYQTCALVKSNPDYQAIPFVLVSSRDGLFDRARGRLVGADAHLSKPFTQVDLVNTIQACLQNNVPAENKVDSLVDTDPDEASNAATESEAEALDADDTISVAPV